MKQITLANTDLSICPIAMGCWGLSGDMTWGPQDEAAGQAAIHAALDLGINFFDTAEMYGNGISEQRLGKALKDKRDQAVIASKPSPDHNRPADLIASCHRTLEYLQTDYLDIYQVHWSPSDVPLAETWGAMQSLRDEGKVRYIGVCNFGPNDLAEITAIEKPATNQIPYSLLARGIEYAVLPACQQLNLGVLCYSPLMLGLLTGKFMDADEVPAGRARSRHFAGTRELARHGEPGCETETFDAINAVRQIASDADIPMADLAIAWVLTREGADCVLVGLRKPDQAKRNIAALNVQLSDDIIQQLNDATETLKATLGTNVDLWQPEEKSRYH